MKKTLLSSIIYIIFYCNSLFGANIFLNSAEDNSTPFALLHIKDETPFECKEILLELQKKEYECNFGKKQSTPLENKETKYFDINFFNDEKGFLRVHIKPKMSSRLYPFDINLKLQNEITFRRPSKVNHWTIIASIDEKLFFNSSKNIEKLNFPVYYNNLNRPYIGALDLNAQPITYTQGKDLGKFLDVKKLYEAQKYNDLIEEVDLAISRFPNSIFRSEFLLFKLRSLNELLWGNSKDERLDFGDLVVVAKEWIRAYPSDENLPEVLYLLANTYLKAGINADAEYILDILISEHEKTKFAKMGILSFADKLYNTKNKAKAIKLYEDVLFTATDLDVASKAAIILGQISLNEDKKEKATEYFEKVLNANSPYLLKDASQSHQFAKEISQKELFDIAAKIGQKLIEKSSRQDVFYEELLIDTAYWLSKTKNKKESLELYKRYQKEFVSGDFNEAATEGIDRLLFEMEDQNSTSAHLHYDKLIENYKEDEISQKATLKKGQLFNKEKRYEDTVLLKDNLIKISQNFPEANTTLQSALEELMASFLDANECVKALENKAKYGEYIKKGYEIKLEECYLKHSSFNEALELAQKNILPSAMDKKLFWIESMTKSLKGVGKYKDALIALNDTKALYGAMRKKVSYEILEIEFELTKTVGQKDKLLNLALNIEKEYPENFKNIEILYQAFLVQKELQDDLSGESLAKKIILTQKVKNSFVFSPQIEFEYIVILKKLNKFQEAVEILDDLLGRIDEKNRPRVLYSKGEILIKTGKNDEAKKALLECSDSQIKNNWSELCSKSLELLK